MRQMRFDFDFIAFNLCIFVVISTFSSFVWSKLSDHLSLHALHIFLSLLSFASWQNTKRPNETDPKRLQFSSFFIDCSNRNCYHEHDNLPHRCRHFLIQFNRPSKSRKIRYSLSSLLFVYALSKEMNGNKPIEQTNRNEITSNDSKTHRFQIFRFCFVESFFFLSIFPLLWIDAIHSLCFELKFPSEQSIEWLCRAYF